MRPCCIAVLCCFLEKIHYKECYSSWRKRKSQNHRPVTFIRQIWLLRWEYGMDFKESILLFCHYILMEKGTVIHHGSQGSWKVKVVKHGSFNSSLITTGITEQVRLEGSSGDHLAQPPPSKQGHLNRSFHGSVQLGIVSLQGWIFHSSTGQPVLDFCQPWTFFFYHFLFNIEFTGLQFIVILSIHWATLRSVWLLPYWPRSVLPCFYIFTDTPKPPFL